MLTTSPDGRRFFTPEANYPLLLEFAKTFGAELSIIKAQEPIEILELSELTKSMCDQAYNDKGKSFEIVETKFTPSGESQYKIKTADDGKVGRNQEIKNNIREKLLSGKEVALKSICQEFEASGLSPSTLCNYFKQVRISLINQGYGFAQIKRGCYKLVDRPEKRISLWQDDPFYEF